MKNLKKLKKKEVSWTKNLFITVFVSLYLSTHAFGAAANDSENSYFGRFTGWFNQIKDKIAITLSALTSKKEVVEEPKQLASAPVAATGNAGDTNRQIATTQKEEAKPSLIVLPKVEVEKYSEAKTTSKVLFGRNFDVITEKVTKLEEFKLAHQVKIPEHNVLWDQVPKYKTNKIAKTIDAFSKEELAKEKTHVKFDLSKVSDAPDLRSVVKSNLKPLNPQNEKPLNQVELRPRDEIEMLVSLIMWLADPVLNVDMASGKLFHIGNQSKSAEAKQKSLTFLGWILEENNYKALATVFFARSLNASDGNTWYSDYDNAAFKELGNLSKDALSAKTSLLKGVKASQNKELDTDSVGYLKLIAAETALDNHQWTQARKQAVAVPNKSKWKERARYIAAYSLIAEKDSDENYKQAGKELTELFKTVDDQDVFDVTAVTLGRIHFILGNYKAAHQYLSQVSKDTNLFIEGAIDNGWALLRSGDQNNAVGNMFTLHTPFFEGAYMPESYFLQGLGYQDICQFGDALTSVKTFKTRYLDSYKKVASFNKSGKTKDTVYYDELVQYLTKKESSLPGILLTELARHPEFLKRQKTINAFAKEQRTLSDKFVLNAKQINESVEKDLEAMKGHYKVEMQAYLKKRALSMEDELKFLTANMALLEYEIFAGAGQNLSLQGAQDFAVDEKVAVKKPEYDGAGKEYWPYEDEIWEDELNNFRSRIVNNCAKVAKK